VPIQAKTASAAFHYYSMAEPLSKNPDISQKEKAGIYAGFLAVCHTN
jgi:hypothetical protein